MQHPRPVGPVNNIDAPFSVEMTQGVTAPKSRYMAPFHQGHQVSQTTPVGAPLSIEMTAGAAPTRNRAFVFPKIGWSVSQTTPVDATFSIEMTQGAAQPRFRYRAPSHQGHQWWTPEVEAFGIEQVQGSRPDRNRQRLGPRIGQPSSQPTHTAAPFSVEMAQGIAVLRTRQRNDIRMRSGWVGQTNPGPDAPAVTEVLGGPHRYLWAPPHLHAVAWSPHVREFLDPPHARTYAWSAHRSSFTWPFHRREE